MSSKTNSNNGMGRWMWRWIARVHGDQSGSISVITVFAVILLTMLLGMVTNSGLQVDQKVKMQNAADAATYSGAVVITRGMNTLAFTNHLLSDVFALTAFMREARDRSAESLTPKILSNWARIGPELAGSEFLKFAELGRGIEEKVPHEREIVRTFSEWSAAASELMLPVFEQLLAEQQIPEFQRALVRTTPALAQVATEEIARRHGAAWPRPTALRGVLWRTSGDTVGGPSEEELRTLPVVDPVLDSVSGQGEYAEDARRQRFQLAHRYLRNWNDGSLPLFDSYAKMSQFSSLWRIFTGGQLQKLLDTDYPDSNLPCQMLTRPERITNLNEHLESRYMFVGVVSRQKMADHMPGVFRNPVMPDTHAYAQVMMFVPKRRLIKDWVWPGANEKDPPIQTGIPGEDLRGGSCPEPGDPPTLMVIRQDAAYHPEPWTLINQNWTVQLTPATCGNLPKILSDGSCDTASGSPNLQSLTAEEFLWLSHH